ncbi:unnamed protein product [Penicillium egyptiacum]|uniref:Uncharacterized protein n=1 Tax=Penicillium egyptiacum TaxID=1303716 RepID=A0A9W4P655_9EURO|nr:unnamed protein product [Penicillium egyptiacum]
MKGTVSWFCVSCHNSDAHRMKVKFTAHEPGSCLVCVWSYLLPAKRRININTLCANCLEETNLLSSKEQRAFIHKKKDQIMFERSVAWVKQEWDFWVTCRECQRINESLQQNKGLHVHLVGGVSI